MTIGIWWLPLLVTFAVWGWAVLMPAPRPSGMYDFSGPLSALFRFVAALVITLVSWLIWAVLT